jgi:hypothetical protein
VHAATGGSIHLSMARQMKLGLSMRRRFEPVAGCAGCTIAAADQRSSRRPALPMRGCLHFHALLRENMQAEGYRL